MVIQFTEDEERKLYGAMYFLFKGISLLDGIHSTVFERMVIENDTEKSETKDFLEKILKISEASARIDDEYIYTEDEVESARRERKENQICEWLEENVCDDTLKTFLSLKD